MLSRCFLDFSVGVGTFLIGLNQNFFFLPFSLTGDGQKPFFLNLNLRLLVMDKTLS